MEEGTSYDRKRKWFVWGILLAWTPSIPLVIMFFNSFREISTQKATGLGAVAGGVSEGYTTFGFILALVLPVGAIVLLAKSISGGHRMRSLFSILSICWSALALFFVSLFVWLLYFYSPGVASGPR